MFTAVVLMLVVPAPLTVREARRALLPTKPLKEVWPPVVAVRAFGPLSVPLKLMAPLLVAVSVASCVTVAVS